MDYRESAKPPIAGVREIDLAPFRDHRGLLAKLPHDDFAEEFYSVSGPNVLRGLHFQLPPFHCSKLVCCLHGAVLDVLVDLRTDSPTFGRHEARCLHAGEPTALIIPAGVAHGFYVLDAPAILLYRQSALHAPCSDGGIRWDSAGIQWGPLDPILSHRDTSLPKLKDFESPFRL